MAIIEGKVDFSKNISAYAAAEASDVIRKFTLQSECLHNEDIIIEKYVHPHNGDENEIKQCTKCGKIL